jgi:hypothetical protein
MMLLEITLKHGVVRRLFRMGFIVLSLSIFCLQFSICEAQQRQVIAGLEGHTEYRALLRQEASLVRSADSLAAGIASMRGRLRADTLDRAALSASIVSMEERSFELRSTMARLASRINTIEQEWILANLSTPRPASSDGPDGNLEGGDGTEEADSPTKEGAYDSWFESGLSADQMAELRRAREIEGGLPLLVDRYRQYHGRLVALAGAYNAARSQAPADSIRERFDALNEENRVLAQRIGSEWSTAFDNKSYLYNLLADKQNRGDLLRRFEQGLERLREQLPPALEMGAPAPLVDHVLQRLMLADYEIALAAELGDVAVADSLRAVASSLPGPLSLAGLEPVTLTERLFLDYAETKIGGSPYNSSNPIPEVAVWPRGIIWRVMVGGFTQRQSPSVFRGAHPLAVQRGDDGRYRYFAGGYPTDSLALAAVERLRKAGFRAPTAVVWMDGVYIDPAADEGAKDYRIEITGAEELPAVAREAAAGGAIDIVRGPGRFIVTPLDATTAVRLRQTLESLKPELPGTEIKLSKIPE